MSIDAAYMLGIAASLNCTAMYIKMLEFLIDNIFVMLG